MNEPRREVERFLLDLAGAVTDETPVDWEEERRTHPELSRQIDRMRVLQAMAETYRTVEGVPPAPPFLFQWGHLRVLEQIGQGSFGDVYRAFDTVLQREVALKLRRGDRDGGGSGARRVLAEARRLAQVRHPNVLVVHGADVHDGRVGLWTDLVRGRTLEERLAAEGPCGADEAALVGVDLCRALAAIHAAGLVHGDLKCANVMREEGGRILLMDFGSVSELPGERGATAAGAAGLSGTPLAMAPEVLQGDAPTRAADIYALGNLLYRLVSGVYPLTARSADELQAMHASGERVPLRDARPDLPTAFVTIIERALAGDPAERYASTGAMEAALAQTLESARPPRRAAEGTPPPAPRTRRRGWAWVIAAAVVLAIIAVAGNSLLERSRRASTPEEPQTAPRSAGAPSSPPQAVETGRLAGSANTNPIAAARIDVNATLHRVREGREEALPSGALVHPGDDLFLRIKGTEPMHVYVLNEDETGDLFALFPVAGLDIANPLAGDVEHRLPGARAGVVQDWQVTSAGEKESILVIASRQPLLPLEREIAKMPAAEAGRPIEYPRIEPQALEGFRGIGGLEESRSARARSGEGRLATLARSLPEMVDDPGGIWVRLFELHNVGR